MCTSCATQLIMCTSCATQLIMCTSCATQLIMCTSCATQLIMCTSCATQLIMCTSCATQLIMCTSRATQLVLLSCNMSCGTRCAGTARLNYSFWQSWSHTHFSMKPTQTNVHAARVLKPSTTSCNPAPPSMTWDARHGPVRWRPTGSFGDRLRHCGRLRTSPYLPDWKSSMAGNAEEEEEGWNHLPIKKGKKPEDQENTLEKNHWQWSSENVQCSSLKIQVLTNTWTQAPALVTGLLLGTHHYLSEVCLTIINNLHLLIRATFRKSPKYLWKLHQFTPFFFFNWLETIRCTQKFLMKCDGAHL